MSATMLELYNSYISRFDKDIKIIPQNFKYCSVCGGYTYTVSYIKKGTSTLVRTRCNICDTLFNIDVPDKMPYLTELAKGVVIEEYDNSMLDAMFCAHCCKRLDNCLYTTNVMKDLHDFPAFIISCPDCKSVYAIMEK